MRSGIPAVNPRPRIIGSSRLATDTRFGEDDTERASLKRTGNYQFSKLIFYRGLAYLC